MFGLCADKQIDDITHISVTDARIAQMTGNSMDAGRGEQKAIIQASLTPTRNILTRT